MFFTSQISSYPVFSISIRDGTNFGAASYKSKKEIGIFICSLDCCNLVDCIKTVFQI